MRTLRHAFERRELVDEVALHVVGELEHVALRARDVEPDDRIRAAVDLGDLRRIGFERQARRDARQPLAHVVGGAVEIAIERELDVDLRALVAARGIQALDAFDAGDLVLDDLRDARLDDVGARRRDSASRR